MSILPTGLIGRKLCHSYSPELHRLLGGEGYRLFELEENEVGDFLLRGEFKALNVTVPYKKTVLPYLSALSETATKTGCVNCITKLPDGGLLGSNTDVEGFGFLLDNATAKAGIESISGEKVLVLGSGGASLAVQAVLSARGANMVVVSRSGENYHNYSGISEHRDALIIVNTTPIGMFPDCSASPLDLSGIISLKDTFPSLHLVIDLIYNPQKTILLLKAENEKIATVNGLLMLAAQGKISRDIFLGKEPYADTEQIVSVTQTLRNMMQNITLVGMAGVGKTSIGKVLAARLGMDFTDTDKVIEMQSGKRITDLLDGTEESEKEFRKLESAVLDDVSKRSHTVIACGGGIVERPWNKYAARRGGPVVWLDAPTCDLATSDRPLYIAHSPSEMRTKRANLYEDYSDITVTREKSPDETAEKIIAALKAKELL